MSTTSLPPALDGRIFPPLGGWSVGEVLTSVGPASSINLDKKAAMLRHRPPAICEDANPSAIPAFDWQVRTQRRGKKVHHRSF